MDARKLVANAECTHDLPRRGCIGIRPVTAAARGHDDDPITSVHKGRRLASQADRSSRPVLRILANPQVDSSLALTPSRHAIWRDDSSLGQNRNLHGSPEFNVPNASVAAAVKAGSSAVGSDRKLVQEDRVSSFENLGVRNSGICYVRVDAALALPICACSGPSGYSFVRPESLGDMASLGVGSAVTERQVVACPLRGCAGLKRLENQVDDSL